MTIPSVISKVSGATNSETLNQKIILPGNIQSGDMIFIAVSYNRQPTITWDNSTAGAFTSLFNLTKSSTVLGTGYYKIANGTESSLTLSIVTSISAGASWTTFLIQGHNSSIEATVTGTSTGLTSSPVELTPTWGSKDVLWINGLAIPATPSVTTVPSGYSATYTIAGTGGVRSSLTTIEKGVSNTLSESIAQSSWVVSNSNANIMFLVGIQGAIGNFTITSVNNGNDVYSGQTLVKVRGTNLTNVTSATYKGVACTEISKSSSLSITMTFPNFFTNNIKVGAQHALKIRG
jgi:hypothetical protein